MIRHARSAEVIAFPKPVMRGRKRVSRYVDTSGGDLALMLIERDGGDLPANVVRLVTMLDETPEPGRTALGLALAMFTLLGEEQQDAIRNSLRCMKYGGNRANRELAIEVDRIIGRRPSPSHNGA